VTARNLLAAEATKLFTTRITLILATVTILVTWPMAWTNAASGADLPADDPRLFSSEPIPVEYQGFDMAGFGYVLIVALGALWAGSEYGAGRQIRTTLIASPNRAAVFLVKSALLTVIIGATAFLTMWGTIVITHASANSGVSPWALSPAIWAHIAGVTAAWILTGLMAFAIGTLARTAILPLILLIPFVIGISDLLTRLWIGARFLPIAAGAAMYSDPDGGAYLAPLAGGIVQAAWALILLAISFTVFVRRDT